MLIRSLEGLIFGLVFCLLFLYPNLIRVSCCSATRTVSRWPQSPRSLTAFAPEIAEESGRGHAFDVLVEVASAGIRRRSADCQRRRVLDLVTRFTGTTDQGTLGGDIGRKSEQGHGDVVLRVMLAPLHSGMRELLSFIPS